MVLHIEGKGIEITKLSVTMCKEYFPCISIAKRLTASLAADAQLDAYFGWDLGSKGTLDIPTHEVFNKMANLISLGGGQVFFRSHHDLVLTCVR